MPAITLHHLEASRSHRILWLLEELELDYEIVAYARDPKTSRAPPELRAIHPLGLAPVVTIDDRVLAESGAIIEYLVEHFGDGSLRPEAGTVAHQDFRYWLHYAEGSLMPPLLVSLITSKVRQAKVPFFVKPIAKAIVGKLDEAYTTPALELHMGWVEGWLATHSWFAGDRFSGADVQMSFPVEASLTRGGGGDFPNMAAWIAKVKARPAWVRAEERGGALEILG